MTVIRLRQENGHVPDYMNVDCSVVSASSVWESAYRSQLQPEVTFDATNKWNRTVKGRTLVFLDVSNHVVFRMKEAGIVNEKLDFDDIS